MEKILLIDLARADSKRLEHVKPIMFEDAVPALVKNHSNPADKIQIRIPLLIPNLSVAED